MCSACRLIDHSTTPTEQRAHEQKCVCYPDWWMCVCIGRNSCRALCTHATVFVHLVRAASAPLQLPADEALTFISPSACCRVQNMHNGEQGEGQLTAATKQHVILLKVTARPTQSDTAAGNKPLALCRNLTFLWGWICFWQFLNPYGINLFVF